MANFVNSVNSVVNHRAIGTTGAWLMRTGALFAGAASVFAFAPFELAPLAIVTLGALFYLLLDARDARTGAWLGFAFGLGLFGAGVSWVYIALETFGGMPVSVALVATAGFVAFLSLYPMLAGWAAVRFTPATSLARTLACAAAWTLAEWLRGMLLTGFPWLAAGYSQLPGSVLAGFASLGGVTLVSLAVATCAALLAYATWHSAEGGMRPFLGGGIGIVAIAAAGALAARVEWTRPAGEPLAVSLVQGNVTQDLKFDPDFRERTFALYAALAERARGRLIVLPESAFPVFADEVPDAAAGRLAQTARSRRGDLLLGLFTLDAPLPGSDQPRYYNSVVSLGVAPTQLYRKRHLVPFGETIPLEALTGWFIRSVLAIPLASQSAGASDQPPFATAGQKVALTICYEDAFGSELADVLGDATLIVNVTNDAWYGRSIAAWQHNQIAAMRALELGRPMLRATNTGITSAIAHDGRQMAALPWFTRGVLEIEIAGREGATPYARWRDSPALALAFVLLAGGVATARRRGNR